MTEQLAEHHVVLQNGRLDVVCSCGRHYSKDPGTNDLVPDAIELWAKHYREGATEERERLAQAWSKGMNMGTSRAMRHMSDEPHLELASEADNPYREQP